jgi:hypothetical protein
LITDADAAAESWTTDNFGHVSCSHPTPIPKLKSCHGMP